MSSKEVDRIRKLIYVKSADKIGKEYNRWYNGKQVKHITLEYKEKPKGAKVYRTKYVKTPMSIYNKAIKVKKFTPIVTVLDTT